MTRFWIQVAQLLKQLLMDFDRPGDDHPEFVVTDVNEIVGSRRKQICIPSKDKTGKQERIKFDDLIAPKGMARRRADWSSLAKCKSHFLDYLPTCFFELRTADIPKSQP